MDFGEENEPVPEFGGREELDLPPRQERLIKHMQKFCEDFDESKLEGYAGVANELENLIPKIKGKLAKIPMVSFKNGPGLLVGYYYYSFSGEKPDKKIFRQPLPGSKNLLEPQDIRRYERFWETFEGGKFGNIHQPRAPSPINAPEETFIESVREFGGYQEVEEEF
jgi:hypothetical protein